LKYEEEIVEHLHNKNAIDESSYQSIVSYFSAQKFSIHWELRSLLYIGITLFTSGLSVFIYNNIGELGHIALIILLFGACIASYIYNFKNALPFSKQQVNQTNPFYDYAVLLASLLLISAIGYLQFKYNFLGGLGSFSTLIISFVLFATAFRFDHKGVLTLAISFHASFFGLVVTPLQFLDNMDNFAEQNLLYVALGLGVLLYVYVLIINYLQVKIHFAIVLLNFAVNIFLIAALMGVFTQSFSGIYYLILLVGSIVSFFQAKHHQSFAIYLTLVLTNFIALSYFILKAFFDFDTSAAIYLGFLYLIFGGAALVYLLKNHKTILGYDKV
jgi:hypothetical protein